MEIEVRKEMKRESVLITILYVVCKSFEQSISFHFLFRTHHSKVYCYSLLVVWIFMREGASYFIKMMMCANNMFLDHKQGTVNTQHKWYCIVIEGIHIWNGQERKDGHECNQVTVSEENKMIRWYIICFSFCVRWLFLLLLSNLFGARNVNPHKIQFTIILLQSTRSKEVITSILVVNIQQVAAAFVREKNERDWGNKWMEAKRGRKSEWIKGIKNNKQEKTFLLNSICNYIKEVNVHNL